MCSEKQQFNISEKINLPVTIKLLCVFSESWFSSLLTLRNQSQADRLPPPPSRVNSYSLLVMIGFHSGSVPGTKHSRSSMLTKQSHAMHSYSDSFLISHLEHARANCFKTHKRKWSKYLASYAAALGFRSNSTFSALKSFKRLL